MTDLLQGKGTKALFVYKVLPFVLLSAGLFFINTQQIRFFMIGGFLVACVAFILLYPVKAYVKEDRLFYKKTFGAEKSILLSDIKELTPEYRRNWGWSYTIMVKYGNRKKLAILGLADKNRGFMKNTRQLPPFYVLETLMQEIRRQQAQSS